MPQSGMGVNNQPQGNQSTSVLVGGPCGASGAGDRSRRWTGASLRRGASAPSRREGFTDLQGHGGESVLLALPAVRGRWRSYASNLGSGEGVPCFAQRG